MMKYELAHYSVGGGRHANEDRIGAAERGNAVLLVVADGLGGHSGGELAAQTLVDAVLRVFQKIKQPRIDDPFSFLALTILQAHRAVVRAGRAHVPPLEARTTCVVCLVQDGYAYWAHVGDSRLYHFRRGQVVTRTRDHTSIEQLHQSGLLTEEEMTTHPRRSYLMQSIGGNSSPSITLGDPARLEPGDLLLLCTDGLWEATTSASLATALAGERLDEVLEELLLATEKRMGEGCDNVSAVCLRWQDRIHTGLPLVRTRARPTLRPSAPAPTRRPMPTPAPASEPEPADGSIEQRIREMEEYLRRFESK